MTQRKTTRLIYKEMYAARLIKLGHKVIETLPNPRYPRYTMWVFENDETFDDDFEKIKGGK